ncbi:MAG: metal-dependent hydrolase [Bacteroidota bacterium]
MDSLTQATLGAAIGELFLGKKMGKKGALVGAVVATIPDLDVALYLFYGQLDMLSIHRGLSHSILFSFSGALLIAYILSRMKLAKEVSFKRLYVFSWAALITHILLDVFTAYGTQIYEPFSDERIGFDSINVIDPLYTTPLMIGLLCSLFFIKNDEYRKYGNISGLLVSTFYLLLTLGIKQHVENQFYSELKRNKIEHEVMMTMPVGVASINWYGVVKTEKEILLRKYSLLKGYKGAFEFFPINDHLLEGINRKIVDKMIWFAKGLYTVDGDQNQIRFYNLQVDMRGMVIKEEIKAPTKGYFLITRSPNGEYQLSSGSH